MTLLGAPDRGKSEGDPPVLLVHGLLLAAGRGSRFGEGKLHALYRGRPLISYALSLMQAAFGRGLLHAGYAVIDGKDERSAVLARESRVTPVLNQVPEAGLSGSLRLGLEQIERDARAGAAVVFLGDQPLIRMEVLETLVTAWGRSGAAIIRPRYAARPEVPGHPVVLSRSVWRKAWALEGDAGFSAVPRSHSEAMLLVDVPGDNPDVDTQTDLRRLEEATG